MKTASVTRKTRNKISPAATKRPQKFAKRVKDGASYPIACALSIVVLICYANSLVNDFVFDDQYLVLIYSRPRDFSHLLEMMINSYRPVRNLSYILDFAVWGANPFGFHLTNVLIH